MARAATSNHDRVCEVQHYAWCVTCGEEPENELTPDSLRGWAIWHIANNTVDHEIRIVNHTVRLYSSETVSPEQIDREIVRRENASRRVRSRRTTVPA